MKKVQTSVFWKAGILTIIIFGLGILLGYTLESGRISEIESEFKQVEIEWADAKLQSLYYQTLEFDLCEAAIDENLKFADKVYQQGLKLERYEESNKMDQRIKLEHQRYSLLKTEFLLNSILLKNKCFADYVNLIYFYKKEPNLQEKSSQRVQSVILTEIKEILGPKVMLIPLATDLDISIINILTKSYNITIAPTLIIENQKFEGIQSQEEILNHICQFYKEKPDICPNT